MSDIILYRGDCVEMMDLMLADDSVDACVTDPPYGLKFMGKGWDDCSEGLQMQEWHRIWAKEVFRVLKPGAYLLAFSGTRTYHRMVCAIEDAGFEIRDQIDWVYGSGFPKSRRFCLDMEQELCEQIEIDGKKVWFYKGSTERMRNQPPFLSEDANFWSGWGTALKPAHEPIVVARKPLEGTVANNVLKHGCGGLNIDGCRIGTEGANDRQQYGVSGDEGKPSENAVCYGDRERVAYERPAAGRWPANLCHDGSEEVLAGFPETISGTRSGHRNEPKTKNVYGSFDLQDEAAYIGDSGSAARFFKSCPFDEDDFAHAIIHYCAKASKKERDGSKHPTVKPKSLMRYLVRLVTPPDGLVIDPFAGTGTTGIAAREEGFKAVLFEREDEYADHIEKRLDWK